MLLNRTIAPLLMAAASASVSNNNSKHMVNSSFVIHVVTLLQQYTEFKNVVFYISQQLNRDTDDVSSLFLRNFWKSFPTTPLMIMLNNSNSMMGLLDTPSLCVIMTTKWNDPVMQLAASSLNGRRYFRTIFLYFPMENYAEAYPSLVWFEEFYENINLLYEWIWERRFLNTMLMTSNNNIYLYEAYPTGNVVNKTNDWKVEEFFPQKKLNLKGWDLETPVRFDLPRVFCMRRLPHKGRESKLSGTSGKLFEAFVKFINGSFNETLIEEDEFKPFNSRDLLQMVEHDDSAIEISVHSYTAILSASVDNSYPVGINDWCLMVPFRNKSLEVVFLRKSFQKNTWLLLCFAAVYITVGIWLCTPPQKRDVSMAFLETICCLLTAAPQTILILPYARLRFLSLLLFVLGFCLTNIYLSKMATSLTASSDENQIRTIQDVIDANLYIMVPENDYKTLVNIKLSPELLKMLIPTSEGVANKHRESFNTSYGYTITTDRWNFFNRQQSFLKKPLFRLTSICVGPFYHVFPLATNSDLTQPFMEFILDVQQSGLTFFWEVEAFYDALFLNYVQLFKIDNEFTPLSIDFFRSIYYVWFFGLSLATLALMAEIMMANFTQVRKVANKWIKLF